MIDTSTNSPSLSVVIPVTERIDAMSEIHREYVSALEEANQSFELIYVLDGPFPEYREGLEQLKKDGEALTIIQLGKSFGEAAALEAGCANSNGHWILTLPAYFQVETDQLALLFEDADSWDMIIGRRNPRIDSKVNQLLSRAFHGLVNWMTACKFHDLSSGTRLIRRDVLDELPLYGDQHRFLPVLAARRGYRVREIDLSQSSKENFRRLPRLGVYPRRVLDLLIVFFLVKFTKKPLRFFGLIGAGFCAIGGIWTLLLVFERIFLNQSLADRPALLLAALLIVLGVQLFALGLIAEIVIFTHAKHIREYTIETIIN